MSRLRYGCQCRTLAVAQHCPSPTYILSAQGRSNFREIFKQAFKIYSIWPQANKYVTNTLQQCSSASVGLAQARPNYIYVYSFLQGQETYKAVETRLQWKRSYHNSLNRCNAVPLVLGLLRLAPIIFMCTAFCKVKKHTKPLKRGYNGRGHTIIL